MKKRTYIYRSFERFWHWSQALLIFFLALTGFEVHGSYKFFGYEYAVRWHDIAAWAFLVLIVFAIFWHFVTGEWKQYIPTTKFMKAQIAYYITGIFKGAPHPTHKAVYNKFNPLQRVTYLGLKLLVIPVQVITGLIYMFYVYPNNPIQMGGLSTIALIHTLGAFALIVFVIIHVYLTTTGDTPLSSIQAMITGWEVLNVDEKEERVKHLQQAVDESVAGYYRLDNDGIIQDANEAWLRMYKYNNPEDIIGKHYGITRDKDSIKNLENLVERVLKGERLTGIPVERKCADGSTGQHVLSANPIVEDGKITGMEGFILDISDEKEYNEHIYNTIRDSSAGYYRLNEEGIIEDVNEAWLALYKFNSREEIIGKHFSMTRDSNELENLTKAFNKVMNGETIAGTMAVRKCKDGTIGKHILSANPVHLGNRVVGMEGFILDLTHFNSKI